MAKGILEFDLLEEETEFNNAINGSKILSHSWDFSNYLRNILKHNPDKYSDEILEVIEEIEDRFNENFIEFFEV